MSDALSQENDNCQRTLVFQGGGALGAYEASTYQHIYRRKIQMVDCLTLLLGSSIGSYKL